MARGAVSLRGRSKRGRRGGLHAAARGLGGGFASLGGQNEAGEGSCTLQLVVSEVVSLRGRSKRGRRGELHAATHGSGPRLCCAGSQGRLAEAKCTLQLMVWGPELTWREAQTGARSLVAACSSWVQTPSSPRRKPKPAVEVDAHAATRGFGPDFTSREAKTAPPG